MLSEEMFDPIYREYNRLYSARFVENADYSSDFHFFKTDEATDFISFLH